LAPAADQFGTVLKVRHPAAALIVGVNTTAVVGDVNGQLVAGR